MFEPSILGKQMLLARRLVEAGCGFVTVQIAGWDMHADGNNPGIKDGMEMLGRPLDKALSAFLEDLEAARPARQGAGGRDRRLRPHAEDQQERRPRPLGEPVHAGASRRRAEDGPGDRQVATATTACRRATPYSTPNLLSTVMHHLFDVGVLRVTRGVPGNLVKLIEDHSRSRELF